MIRHLFTDSPSTLASLIRLTTDDAHSSQCGARMLQGLCMAAANSSAAASVLATRVSCEGQPPKSTRLQTGQPTPVPMSDSHRCVGEGSLSPEDPTQPMPEDPTQPIPGDPTPACVGGDPTPPSPDHSAPTTSIICSYSLAKRNRTHLLFPSISSSARLISNSLDPSHSCPIPSHTASFLQLLTTSVLSTIVLLTARLSPPSDTSTGTGTRVTTATNTATQTPRQKQCVPLPHLPTNASNTPPPPTYAPHEKHQSGTCPIAQPSTPPRSVDLAPHPPPRLARPPLPPGRGNAPKPNTSPTTTLSPPHQTSAHVPARPLRFSIPLALPLPPVLRTAASVLGEREGWSAMKVMSKVMGDAKSCETVANAPFSNQGGRRSVATDKMRALSGHWYRCESICGSKCRIHPRGGSVAVVDGGSSLGIARLLVDGEVNLLVKLLSSAMKGTQIDVVYESMRTLRCLLFSDTSLTHRYLHLCFDDFFNLIHRALYQTPDGMGSTQELSSVVSGVGAVNRQGGSRGSGGGWLSTGTRDMSLATITTTTSNGVSMPRFHLVKANKTNNLTQEDAVTSTDHQSSSTSKQMIQVAYLDESGAERVPVHCNLVARRMLWQLLFDTMEHDDLGGIRYRYLSVPLHYVDCACYLRHPTGDHPSYEALHLLRMFTSFVVECVSEKSGVCEEVLFSCRETVEVVMDTSKEVESVVNRLPSEVYHTQTCFSVVEDFIRIRGKCNG
eukprot:GHVN01051046.1.p1 GENE.GHVN01051046.1~~GHVN01051046.1.p1  ORF type:complete len:745 (-),score=141.45 GHVN01051046.1:2447-4627(-)